MRYRISIPGVCCAQGSQGTLAWEVMAEVGWWEKETDDRGTSNIIVGTFSRITRSSLDLRNLVPVNLTVSPTHLSRLSFTRNGHMEVSLSNPIVDEVQSSI